MVAMDSKARFAWAILIKKGGAMERLSTYKRLLDWEQAECRTCPKRIAQPGVCETFVVYLGQDEAALPGPVDQPTLSSPGRGDE